MDHPVLFARRLVGKAAMLVGTGLAGGKRRGKGLMLPRLAVSRDDRKGL